MSNIGKLSTPSGEGASIELYEDGTYNIVGTNSQPLTFKFGRLWDHVTSNGGQEYQLTMGADRKEGAYLSLRTQDESNGDYKGGWFLGAVDVSNNLSATLRGLPNKTLTWENNLIDPLLDLITNDNGVAIRYCTGRIYQYGLIYFEGVPAYSGITASVTYTLPMSNQDYSIFVTNIYGANGYASCTPTIISRDTTGFKMAVYNFDANIADPLTFCWTVFGF